jgi:predicted S18 family serine protease
LWQNASKIYSLEIKTIDTRSDKKEHVAQEPKKTKSNLRVEHQTPLLRDATIQCTEKLQLKDQENSHIRKLEDKIAKLQQNKKITTKK